MITLLALSVDVVSLGFRTSVLIVDFGGISRIVRCDV